MSESLDICERWEYSYANKFILHRSKDRKDRGAMLISTGFLWTRISGMRERERCRSGEQYLNCFLLGRRIRSAGLSQLWSAIGKYNARNRGIVASKSSIFERIAAVNVSQKHLRLFSCAAMPETMEKAGGACFLEFKPTEI